MSDGLERSTVAFRVSELLSLDVPSHVKSLLVANFLVFLPNIARLQSLPAVKSRFNGTKGSC